MSYDYNRLLDEIRISRSKDPQTPDVIQETLNLFTTLSTKCPMTPLLWMQYAYDAGCLIDKLQQDGALQITCQILELGIAEFPNCAMLRLFHLDCVVSDASKTIDDVKAVWEDVRTSVCVGCNGGGDESIIVSIFNLYTHYMVKKNFPKDQLLQTFLLRARLFLKSGNQSLRAEMNDLSEQHSASFTPSEYDLLERNRQFSSQNLNFLGELEDDVLIAMESDGIASTPDLSLYLKDEEIVKDDHCTLTYEWSQVLKAMERNSSYLMGFGMMNSSKAFIKYTQGLIKQIKSVQKLIKDAEYEESDHTEEIKNLRGLVDDYNKMIIQIFERGATECPTVELIWEKYIKHLFYIMHEVPIEKKAKMMKSHLNHLKAVTSRAVRNCPYSVKLFVLKMSVIREEVQAGTKVLEPDDLMDIAMESNNLNFLPTPKNYVEVYMAACSVVIQRILELVSKATSNMAYDDVENLQKKTGKKRKRDDQSSSLKSYDNALSEETEEEINDLIDDLREMYETADNEIRKKFKDLTELREIILRDRAEVEALLLMNLTGGCDHGEVLDMYEKLIRVHQCPHPNSWRCYIDFVKGKTAVTSQINPGNVAANFRFIRSLFHRSMSFSKKDHKNKEKVLDDPEFFLSLKSLCQDFVSFENTYGSNKTLEVARKMTKEKLQFYNLHQLICHDNINKQSEDGKVDFLEQNKPTPETVNSEDNMKQSIQTTDKVIVQDEGVGIIENCDKKKQTHTVTVGKLKYPAHPFTVHVSNLSKETMDMDVYELFKNRCGSIVHVRIFREKGGSRQYGPPESKCAGLIQFEERESVEEALKLNGEIGLHEKLIQVTRSHQPAVSIVPPGMHRIQPKGQGKNTKRNQKRKFRREETSKEENEGKTISNAESEEVKSTIKEESKIPVIKSSNSILNFRPRGVAQKKKRKAIVSIDTRKN